MDGTKKISRRNFIKGVGAIGAGAALGTAFPRIGAARGEAMRFQNTETDPATIKFLDEVVAEFGKKKGIKATTEHYPTGSEAVQKAYAGIKAGRSYDIVNVGQITWYVGFAGGDHLVPVTNIIKKQGIDDFGPMSLWKYKNEYYFYPYDYNFVSAFYRKDWLEEAGLEPAKTWDQFKNIAKRFTKGDRYGLMHPLILGDATNWAGTNILWSNDVHFFDSNWGVIFDSSKNKPKVIDSLEFLRELHQYMPKGAFQASYSELLNSFTTGTVGITFYAGRLIHHLEKYAPDLSTKYVMKGFPTPDGKKQAVTHATDGWLVIKEGDYTKEALEFMEWLTTDKIIDYLLTLALHYQPVRKSIYQNPKWANFPLLQKHKESVKQMATYLDTDKTIINAIDTEGPTLDPIQSKVWAENVIPEMYQNVLLKNMKPAQAIDIAAAKLREIVKEK